jgi:4-hydroxy-3-polyprenylbenzoate decarboxylase
MAYHDLREFMTACKQAGEMVTVEREVDWNLEMGAVCRRIAEIGAPAVHMKKIRGCPEGWSVLGSPIAKGWHGDFSRVALALEMDPLTPYEVLVEEFLKRMANPIRPIEVATGPCKENVITGADINLFKFPAPYLHLGDGGRYINTFGVTVTKDPDSNWVNWGVYRHMIHKKSILGGIVNPFQHIGMIYYQRYEARGNNMPFAIFFGGCPSAAMVGSMSIPAGATEANAAGGLRRAPLQLVKCQSSDLLVPATAEIVIEGHVRPHERWDEGPFGEATGYRASPRMPRPVFRVDCVTHRNDPIMPVSCPGTELDECEILLGVFSLTTSVRNELKAWGLPIVNAFSPPGLKFALLIVTVERGHPGIADRVASVVRSSKMGVFFQYVMVTEDDVNAINYHEALHAVFTRCNPADGIQIFPLAPGHPLIPFLDLHDKMNSRGAAMTIDATTPPHWDPVRDRPRRVSFRAGYPAELQQRIVENWSGTYGLPAAAGRFR